jgi:hypothetical protein
MVDSHDDLESRFWGSCINSYNEETKQLLYLKLMGFTPTPTWRTPYNFDGNNQSFIDIGGGPCSVLLKFENRKRGGSLVVDPGDYPSWVSARYGAADIILLQARAEDIVEASVFDVALIYNCLQHVDDPEKIIANAKACSKQLRCFEWIDTPPHEGHPQMLTEEALNRWCGAIGRVVTLRGESECYGRAWIL